MKERSLRILGFASLIAFLLLGMINLTGAQASSMEQVGFDCDAQTSIPADQCDALVAIYMGTNGVDWTNKTGWLSDGDPCNWHGVSCDSGVIVALDLYANNLTGPLPLEIGGFPNLRTLTLHDNPLSGPVPLTITFLDLDLFHFYNTSLCEPADPTFQDWFSQIVYRLSSGIQCSPPTTPTVTQVPGQTLVSSPTSTSDILWPHQTLTALATAATVQPTRVISPTPTKYYTISTRTPTPAFTLTPPPSVAGNDGGGGNFFSRIFGGIPTFYYFLMVIPLLLIIIGVVLELRQRGVSQAPFEGGEDISEQLYKLDYYDPNDDSN